MADMMDAFHIVRIENNTPASLQIMSKAHCSNGSTKSGKIHFDLHDGEWHTLKPYTIYKSDWCAIPSEDAENRYKAFKVHNSDIEIRFYCRDLEDKHAVVFHDQHGTQILELFYSNCERKMVAWRFENDGTYIDILPWDGNPEHGMVGRPKVNRAAAASTICAFQSHS